MIAHLDPSTGYASLLSIPRDLFVPNARIEGANKIDAALYQGPSQLVAAIEEDFGIPINHYVELNFDTFASVVNALGGVKMYFPTPLFDAESGLDIRHPGCYSLDGYHALQVVRARHLQIQPTPGNMDHATWPQEGLSDLARIRRTHEFLRVLFDKVAKRGIGNPLTDQQILTSVLPSLTVDTSFSEGLMVHLASAFATTNINTVPQMTYPTVGIAGYGYSYKGYNYGDVIFPVNPTGRNLIDSVFGASPGDSVFTGHPLPVAKSFPVVVENGAEGMNAAASIASGLRSAGFDVQHVGAITPVGPIAETVIWYGGTPPPAKGNWHNPGLFAAEKVLSTLSGPVVMGYNPAMVAHGSLVTVVVGNGTTMTPVVATPVTTTTGHGTTTTTIHSTTTTTVPDPAGIKSSPLFGVPAATSMALQPYDPRACNAAGTGPAAS
jgi:LCP family protein required for cell wall assembly